MMFDLIFAEIGSNTLKQMNNDKRKVGTERYGSLFAPFFIMRRSVMIYSKTEYMSKIHF